MKIAEIPTWSFYGKMEKSKVSVVMSVEKRYWISEKWKANDLAYEFTLGNFGATLVSKTCIIQSLVDSVLHMKRGMQTET